MCEVKLKPRDSVLNTEVSLKEWEDVLPSQIKEESLKSIRDFFLEERASLTAFPLKF